jgi:hypothetical protein
MGACGRDRAQVLGNVALQRENADRHRRRARGRRSLIR